MKRNTALLVVLLAALALPLVAQEGPLSSAEPKGITVQEIIQRFAAKEKEFKQARDNYTYRQDVKVQTMDGDTVDGEYHQVVEVTFDDKGRRQERVVFRAAVLAAARLHDPRRRGRHSASPALRAHLRRNS